MTPNRLFYGDNLDILRKDIANDTVQLVYLDPPFKSSQHYNILFKEKDSSKAASQERAFRDTWTWGEQSQEAFDEAVKSGARIRDVMEGMYRFLGTSEMMAYLSMMAPRLIELRRKLTDSGSIYLHCDPSASHYLKALMDGVFGPEHFRSEIIWKRTSAHSSAKRYGPIHDVILFYTKSETYTWNKQFLKYDADYIKGRFKRGGDKPWKDADLTGSGIRRGETGLVWRGFDVTTKGRHWAYPLSVLDQMDAEGRIYWPKKRGGWPREKVMLTEARGIPLQDVWTDIFPVNSMARERVGFQTQKPIELLKRIIEVSSNRGDVVLDPFCGCGSTIEAAIESGRKWIGIDITAVAFDIIHKRLEKRFTAAIHKTYTVSNLPASMPDALTLAKKEPFNFQRWILECLGVNPLDIKRGPDGGMDGRLSFTDGSGVERHREMIFSVKAGQHISPEHVRSLKAKVADQKAQIGVFVSVAAPTAVMRREAAMVQPYRSKDGDLYPAIQLLTLKEIFEGRNVACPDGAIRFRIRLNPAKATLASGRQQALNFG